GKGSCGLGRSQALKLSLNIFTAGKIVLSEHKADVLRRDPLHWLAINHGKAGAERLMPGNNAIESLDKGLPLELPLQFDTAPHLISRACPFELGQKPQPLLGKGQGQDAVPRHRNNRRQAACRSASDEASKVQ